HDYRQEVLVRTRLTSAIASLRSDISLTKLGKGKEQCKRPYEISQAFGRHTGQRSPAVELLVWSSLCEWARPDERSARGQLLGTAHDPHHRGHPVHGSSGRPAIHRALARPL